MKNLLIGIAVASASGLVFAKDIQVTGVVGTGTVASGSQAVGVSLNMNLVENATVTAAKGSKITIKFPNGCTANVTDAAPFVVNEANCKALLAKSSSPSPAPVVSTTTVAAVGGGTLGLLAIRDLTRSSSPTPQQPISPR